MTNSILLRYVLKNLSYLLLLYLNGIGRGGRGERPPLRDPYYVLPAGGRGLPARGGSRGPPIGRYYEEEDRYREPVPYYERERERDREMYEERPGRISRHYEEIRRSPPPRYQERLE